MSTKVSPPLPLPLNFTLLPSRLPTRTLTPALYTVVNSLSIYLLIPPTDDPHISLLPLILALHPVPPIHILSQLKLQPNDYSLTLNGVAPWVDIWVSWTVARRVCTHLGVGVLFWDTADKGKGLLGENTKECMSWDDSIGICHNWLPASSHLPQSAYSLYTLLKIPFPSVSIIPDDRMVTTPVDGATRAKLIAQCDFGDPTGIGKDWMEAWEGIITWSASAWTDFLRYPSTPSKTRPRGDGMPSSMNSLLPKLSSLTASSPISPSYLPSITDLEAIGDVLNQKPVFESPLNILTPFLNPLSSLSKYLDSFWALPNSSPKLSSSEIKLLQLKARVNLGIGEWIGWMAINGWKTSKETGRMKILMEGSGRSLPREIVVISHSGSNSSPVEEVAQKEGTTDPLEMLERLRNGSPPPVLSRRDRVESSPRRDTSLKETVQEDSPESEDVEIGSVSVTGRSDLSELRVDISKSEDQQAWLIFVGLTVMSILAMIMGSIA